MAEAFSVKRKHFRQSFYVCYACRVYVRLVLLEVVERSFGEVADAADDVVLGHLYGRMSH